MGLLNDTITLYKRELIIYKANLRTNLIRAIIFPVILLLIFGSINSAPKNVPIEVVNYANNPQSVQFMNNLQSQNYVALKGVTTEYQALKDLDSGRIDVVVIILPGFPASSATTTSAGPSVYVYYANNYASLGNSLQQISATAAQFGATTNAALQQGFVLGSTPPESTITLNPTYGTQGNYKTFVAGGLFGMVIVFGSMFGGGMSIIQDRDFGNLKAFLITPVERTALVLSKMLAGTTTGVINAIVMFALIFVFGINIAMGALGIVWILILSVIAAFGFSGMTSALASRVNKVEVYAIAAQTITLPLWFVSGAFSPVSTLPGWLQPLSVIDPLTYVTIGIRDVMMNGYYPLATIELDMAVLAAFIIISTVVAIKVFKTRIE
ncbi:MAG: ABC transporter permease [Candidatus Micrarchaeaceae archaeon]